jgi:beta-galactosidase
VPVDIIDSSLIVQPGGLDKYRLIVAPMLYMLRPGVAEAVNAFVERGGAFVATYITGEVDENDLCFTGGFPGPLRKTLGVWCEETDALYPEERNSLIWNGKSYEVFDFCELIHAEGAEILGTYGSDFYAQRPALTVNKIGGGKAYFIAARTGEDFLNDFYNKLIGESELKRPFKAELPNGVSAQTRSDGKTDYIFIMNFTPSEAKVDCGEAEGIKNLAPYECVIVERST